MSSTLLWVIIGIQVVMAASLVYISIRLALMTIFFRQVLPYVPISSKYTRLIKKSGVLKGRKQIVDLGCGDGVLLKAIADDYPEALYHGVERHALLAFLARMRFLFSRRQAKILQGDMFDFPLAQTDAIIGWWIPDLTPRLVEKFVRECKPGAVIVSAMFALPPHPQLRMEELHEGKNSIYIYTKV